MAGPTNRPQTNHNQAIHAQNQNAETQSAHNQPTYNQPTYNQPTYNQNTESPITQNQPKMTENKPKSTGSKPRITGAVLYTRVSTGEQAKEGTSLGSQRDACRAKAQSLSLPIIAEYEDAGVSGGYLQARPGMQAALADILAGRANTLICANLSRYSRDTEHQQAIKKQVKAAGGTIIFCDASFDDTPEGDLAFGIMGNFAQYERKVIRERTLKGRVARAAQGIQPARRHSPFGYHLVNTTDVLRGDYPADQAGKYIVLPEECAIVQEMFSQYATGQNSIAGLAKWLNGKGVPTRHGAALWWTTTVKYILGNPIYKGLGSYGRRDRFPDEARLSQPHPHTGLPMTTAYRQEMADPSTWITWEVPALVTEDVWDAAQARMQENKRLKSGNPKRVRMLAGRLCCPECETGMVANHRHIAPDGREYWYLMCGRYLQKLINTGGGTRSGAGECVSTPYRSDIVEAAVLTALSDAAQHPESLIEARLTYEEVMVSESAASDGPEDAVHQLERIQVQLKELARKQEAAVQAQIAGIMAGAEPAAYESVFRQIAAQKAALEAQQADLRPKLRTAATLGNAWAVPSNAEMMTTMRRLLEGNELTGAQKRDIIGTVIEKVYPAKDGAQIFFLPNALMENAGFDEEMTDCEEEITDGETVQLKQLRLQRKVSSMLPLMGVRRGEASSAVRARK